MAYLFFFVSKKLSINNSSNANNINVTSCALAAIKSFIKNKLIIVKINDKVEIYEKVQTLHKVEV